MSLLLAHRVISWRCGIWSLSGYSGLWHLDLPFHHLQLELGNGFRRVEALRARLGAVHDGVAAIEPERVFQIVEPLAGGFVTRILDPARRLQQRGGPEKTPALPAGHRA